MNHTTEQAKIPNVGAAVANAPSVGPSRVRAFITVGLMMGMLVAAMEGTVVSTAMPTVIGELHGIRLYPWVFSAYLLTSTTTVPIYGKLADLFGRRSVFLFATALFLVGSMLSGAAHSMPQLIAFRALQGLGAGGVLPLTLTIIGDLYDMRERARVQVLFTSIWGGSSLAGPIIGAFLTEQWSWRWVFYINLPFGLLSALLVGALLQEKRVRASEVRIDYAGSLLMTGGVLALLALLLQAGLGESWLSPRMLTLAALTVVLLGAFLRQERRAPDPMLPLALFAHPVIAASTIGNLLIGVMLYAMDTYLPLTMQAVRGGTAHSASFALTPMLFCWALSAFIGAKALVRWGFAKCGMFGVSCIFVAALSLALMTPQTPLPFLVATMALMGIGLGPSSMAFLVAAQNAVGWEQRGTVTASSQFFRTIGGTVGVGALGAVLNARMAATLTSLHQANLTSNSLLHARALNTLPPAARQAFADGLHLIFLLLACVGLLGFLSILHIVRRPTSVPAPLPEPAEALTAEVLAAEVCD